MPPAAAASAFSTRAAFPAAADLSAFLHGIGMQALCVAGLAVPDRDRAHAAVHAAMARFVRDAGADPAAWPERFWQALDRQLAARAGAAPAGAPSATAAATRQPGDGIALGHLLAALRTLPYRPRQAFLLRVLCELDLATSARVLHLPAPALHGALAQALRHLRTALDPQAAVDAEHDGGAWLLRCRDLLHRATRNPDAGTEARLAAAVRSAFARPPRARLRGVAGWAIAAALVCAGGWWWLHATDTAHVASVTPNVAAGAPAAPAAPGTRAAPADSVPAIAPANDTPLTAPDFDLVIDDDDPALLDDPAFYAWFEATGGDAP